MSEQATGRAWVAPVAVLIALLGTVLAAGFLSGGSDTIWTTSMWSGHDGMQHFRVAVDPLADHPITDNPIRYTRALLPLVAHGIGRLAAPLFPTRVTIPHLGGEPVAGRMLATAWALLFLVAIFAIMAVMEATLLLGHRGALLVATCPLLLLSVTHCLAFPVVMWGTLRLFRLWSAPDARRGSVQEIVMLVLLPLVHGAALILVAARALSPWLEVGASRRRRLGAAGLAVVCVLPLAIWSMSVAARPGFSTAAPEGAGIYARAAFRLIPGAGLVEGVKVNLDSLASEIAAGDWLSGGARLARHALLLLATALFVALPVVARRGRDPGHRHLAALVPGGRLIRPLLAYWLLGVALIALVGWQVTSELDNLGRFLFVSPVVFATILLVDGRRPLATAAALLAFVAVDVNYAASFLGKVAAGGAGVTEGLAWW